MAATIIEKIWKEHQIADLGDGTCLIYIDRVFLHERTGSVALKSLEALKRLQSLCRPIIGLNLTVCK